MLLPLHLLNLLDGSVASAAVTGTASSGLTEAQIVAGGETIIITLTNDTWVAAGGTFNAIRQDIIDGLDSAQSETLGWNAEVRDKEVVGAVVRTSDTVVTITLTAAAAYDVTADETITVTVPATAVTGGSAITATPTIGVTADVEEEEESATGGWAALNAYDAYRQRKSWRKKKREKYEAYLETLDEVDREIAQLLQEPEEEIALRELEALVVQYQDQVNEAREFNERVGIAFERAARQRNYSALMAFEREVERAREEEEFLLLAIAMLA